MVLNFFDKVILTVPMGLIKHIMILLQSSNRMGGRSDYRWPYGYPLLLIESEGYHRDSIIFSKHTTHNTY